MIPVHLPGASAAPGGSGAITGIGLRQPHYADFMSAFLDPSASRPRRPPPFVEVHSENFFGDGGAALQVLQGVREQLPVSLHGVGLSLGSAAGLDAWHLDRLARLVERIDPVRVSDHACFARDHRRHANDLLPIGRTRASLDLLVAHVHHVQDRLRRPFGVENLSAYVAWDDDEMDEPAFFSELVRRTGCWLLLDVNNLVVNALNAGQDPVAAPCAWIDALGPVTVGEIHLAGYHVMPPEDASGPAGDAGVRAMRPLVIDDHGSRVHDPVWAVYAHALRRLGSRPTLVEWDTDLPSLDVLMDEAARADAIAQACPAPTIGSVDPVLVDVRAPATDSPPVAPDPAPERWRQHALLETLWTPSGQAASPSDPAQAAGLRAYRANAAASAERALAAACPTVQQLMGNESFDALARAVWHRAPPERGDLAQWGDALPALLAVDPALQDEPYLADVARVDLAVHHAELAGDAAINPADLQRLADTDADALHLRLAPGATLIESLHPVATLWQAHRSQDEDRFAPVRAAFTAGLGETAFVWRQGWRGQVQAVDAAQARFLRALLDGAALGPALDAVPDLDFEAWLAQALQLQWLAAIDVDVAAVPGPDVRDAPDGPDAPKVSTSTAAASPAPAHPITEHP